LNLLSDCFVDNKEFVFNVVVSSLSGSML
jgi:hypothetical protein